MKHSIKIIFGKEQVNKLFSNVPFTDEEKIINQKEYHFETQSEIDAFLKGVNETVGWFECYIVNDAVK